MLKLTLKPGEFVQIGDDIRVVYTGGTQGNAHFMVEAPREVNIARSAAMERHGTMPKNKKTRYRAEPKLSQEAQDMISSIIASEYRHQRKTGERI